MLPQDIFFDFNSLKSPFLGFRLIQTGNCPNHFRDFNLEFTFIKKYVLFIMKNLTDFRKMVETGMDLCLFITITL